MATCPKCDEKLNSLYIKQVCPHCGANLMYYDFEKRLEADAENAKAEWDWVDKILNGIKKSAVGSVSAVLRLVSFLLPVIALLLPVYKPSTPEIYGKSLSLISVIKLIISPVPAADTPDTAAGTVFGNMSVILMLAAFVCVVLFAIVSAVFSLLSFTKNGFKRDIAFSVMDLAIFIALSAAVIISGGGISYSFFLIIVFMLVTLALNIAVNKKL